MHAIFVLKYILKIGIFVKKQHRYVRVPLNEKMEYKVAKMFCNVKNKLEN